MQAAALKSELLRLASPSSEILAEVKGKYAHLPKEAFEGFIVSDLSENIKCALNKDFNLNGLMIRNGNGANSFVMSASSHLVRCALAGKIDEGIAWFQKVIALKSAIILEVLPLWGIKVLTSTALIKDVQLLPFSALPDSFQKEILVSPDFAKLHYRPVYAWEQPSAALVARWSISPLYYKYEEDHAKVDTKMLNIGAGARLEEVKLCLSLVGPSCVIPAIHWYQFEDADIGYVAMGAGYQFSISEIQPKQISSFGEFSADSASRLVSAYFAMKPMNPRVKLAMERFDRATRRHSPGDAAIELAIALEALLGEGNAEIIWKVSLRAALLIDGTKDEKTHVRNVVKAIYKLRSQVVHSGESPSKIKIAGVGEMQASSAVAMGMQVAAQVIRSIILRQSLPDWDELELGNSAEPN